jgi:hypothetical protein
LRLKSRMATGKTISVHRSVKPMAIDRSSPMLAVPRWFDKVRLPNEAIVVSAA